MLKKEQMEFLSEQLKKYKYYYDENIKANEVLSGILDELKEEFSQNGNVVAYHDSRIKTPNSYLNKLLKNYDSKERLVYEDMHDIVAHRLVCLNLSDIKEFVKLLETSDKINILEERDYIKLPKKSGYRSYHVILEVPFIDNDGVETKVKTEIQLRTILQDIFAREEHKLGYKNNGKISDEDKKTLKELSEELYFFDLSLDKMTKPSKNNKKENEEELKKVEEQFKDTANLYQIIYDDMNNMIKSTYEEYDKKADILHINSRIKSIPSIKRKLVKKKLSYTSENILYGLKDVIGFKVVCTDYDNVKNYIKYITKKINESDKLVIREASDHLDEPKESGYRGYKLNIDYCPKYIVDKPITIEILIRTMVQDAWALQQDARVYNKEESYESIEDYVETARGLKGLSYPIHHVEMSLNDLKEKNHENSVPARNLVKEVKEYQKKNVKKYTLK
ncbi:MAG: hypothetical protein J6O56_05780 [Bacilli bacterium]|nr:hypothetical protein [Bacilli bacterium]